VSVAFVLAAAAALTGAAPAEPIGATAPVTGTADVAPVAPAAAPAAPEAAPAATPISPLQVVPEGTPVRLMVLREITSRTATAGQRFELRVDEPVWINGKPVIPVGAKAWGEIVSIAGNGAVGKGGRLAARLLYLDLPQGHLPLRGEIDQRGAGNGAGVAMAVVGFGILGLLTAGDAARFKGGQTFTSYVDKVR